MAFNRIFNRTFNRIGDAFHIWVTITGAVVRKVILAVYAVIAAGMGLLPGAIFVVTVEPMSDTLRIVITSSVTGCRKLRSSDNFELRPALVQGTLKVLDTS